MQALTEKRSAKAQGRPEIPVRAPRFDFSQPIPLFWLHDNAWLSFMFDGFNLTFPKGERSFVRAVHNHLDQVSDPELKAQMRAFAGQEGQHARAHEGVIAALRAQGFELDEFFAKFDAYMAKAEKRPRAVRLAATAALEHYTAVMADLVFEGDLAQGTYEPLRKLLLWHAVEELEHRAVAFDVLKATHPSYGLRMLGFVLGTLTLFRWTYAGMRVFIVQSGVSRGRMWRDMRATGRMVGGLPRLLARVLAYALPGFHPNQHGNLAQALEVLRAEGLDGAQPLTTAG